MAGMICNTQGTHIAMRSYYDDHTERIERRYTGNLSDELVGPAGSKYCQE
jgi:hypothetical protein